MSVDVRFDYSSHQLQFTDSLHSLIHLFIQAHIKYSFSCALGHSLVRQALMHSCISSGQRQKSLTGYCFEYIDRPFCLQTDDLFSHLLISTRMETCYTQCNYFSYHICSAGSTLLCICT